MIDMTRLQVGDYVAAAIVYQFGTNKGILTGRVLRGMIERIDFKNKSFYLETGQQLFEDDSLLSHERGGVDLIADVLNEGR